MVNQPIEIYIDELVLHGFSPHDRHQIGYALEQELTQLFEDRGLPASFVQSASLQVLNAMPFQMTAHAPAASVGRGLAGAVYNAISTNVQSASQNNTTGHE